MNEEINEEIIKAVDKLNTVNLMDTLASCYAAGNRDAWEVRNSIYKAYPELTCALNSLTLNEFMIYLIIKYPVSFHQVTQYELKISVYKDI